MVRVRSYTYIHSPSAAAQIGKTKGVLPTNKGRVLTSFYLNKKLPGPLMNKQTRFIKIL